MRYQVCFAPDAAEDLQRSFDVLAEQDMPAAERARAVIGQAIEVLQTFPFSCRKASPENPFLREWVISFGRGGYVALFEVDDAETVTVLAMRHQREDNYH